MEPRTISGSTGMASISCGVRSLKGTGTFPPMKSGRESASIQSKMSLLLQNLKRSTPSAGINAWMPDHRAGKWMEGMLEIYAWAGDLSRSDEIN